MQPRPFNQALDFITSKVVEPHDWDSADWAAQEADVRNRAFFSANVEDARFLDRGHRLIDAFMREELETIKLDDGSETTALKIGGRADFVRRMREFMIKEGMLTGDELDRIKETSDTDVTELASRQRLNLIFDTNVRSAWGFGHYKQGMKPAILKRFPAARFIRTRGAQEPRLRHSEHEGDVKLKWDNQWWANYQNDKSLGGFEVPWAPYGYNSYMGQEDVSRAEAERLGLLKEGEQVPTTDSKKTLNDNLKAGTKTLTPAMKQKLLRTLKREQVLNVPTLSVRDQARQAARKARLNAIERSLKKAQERGDSTEVTRITSILEKESKAQKMSVPQFVQAEDDIILKQPVKDSTPVSNALNVVTRKSEMKQVFKESIDAIDGVHSDGILEVTPLKSQMVGHLGHYDPNAGRHEIVVRPVGPWKNLTAVHEIGHMIDHQALGGSKAHANADRWPSTIDSDMIAWRIAVLDSKSVKEMETLGMPKGRKDYFLSNYELWARSYAQFIAEESGNKTLLQDLGNVRKSREPWRQWDAKDFAPIREAIKALFVKKGWI